MMKKLILILKIVSSFLLGALCAVGILPYLRDITIDPLKYTFKIYHVYFCITMLLLPIFRVTHEKWFNSSEEYVSPRGKALQQHHDDIANQYKGGRWSTKGVRVNPYEYTTPYTLSYDSSLDWIYTVAKKICLSLLFILAAPLFYLAEMFLKS
jgi:hypothetical protein